MRHLLRALFVLLLLPALAFGQTFDFPASPTLNQQVTGPNGAIYQWDGTKWVAVGGGGGGGGFTAAGDLSGTSTSQSVIGIRSTAVPALGSGYLHYSGTAFVWDTPAGGVPTASGPYMTLQSNASNNAVWNNYPSIGEATPANTALGIQMSGITGGQAIKVDQNTNVAQWAMQATNPNNQGAAGAQFTAGTTTPVTGSIQALATSNASAAAGSLYISGGTNVSGIVIDTVTGGSVNLEVNHVSVANVTSSGLFLTPALAVGQGGTGLTTAGGSGRLIIAQNTTTYNTAALSQDCTITNTGVITCTKTNNVAFTGLATAAIPLSIANGGRGSSTAPAVGQIDVASSTTAFTPVTMSGDATITSAGALTVAGLKGVAVPTLAAGYLQYTGSAFAWSTPAASLPAPTLWTPTLTATTTAPTLSYTNRSGWIVNAGNNVYLFAIIVSWSANSGGAGTAQISGFPFAASGSTITYHCDTMGITMGSGNTNVALWSATGGTTFTVVASGATTATTGFPQLAITAFAGTGVISCQGWYN